MENRLQNRLPWFGTVGLCVLLALAVCAPAAGQEAPQVQVSGTVTAPSGAHLQGVTVRIRGGGWTTNTTTLTDADGNYELTVPADGVLVFGLIGYRSVAQSIAGRSTINVVMEPAVSGLPEVVATGYQDVRRADFTGALATGDVESINRQTAPSVLQRLGGELSGVTVEHGGSPGSRATVRIRGVTSFQNNDPLYVVDGNPVEESYLNWLNPDDVGSIQVLKDASATSIYGSRASNGVVVVETKRGRPGQRRISLDLRSGVASPVKGYDAFLITNPMDYFQVFKASYLNAGLAVPGNVYGNDTLGNNPSIPTYIWPNDGVHQSCDISAPACTGTRVDPSTYSYPLGLIMPGSPGTDWWKAVFGSGETRNANLSILGAGESNSYLVSFHYLTQDGTARFNRFQRGGVRINTAFLLDRFNVGENLSITRERGYGGLDDADLGENNIIGKNILQQPVVPIFDIAGNYASGKAVHLSNLTNPLKVARTGGQSINTWDRTFGNVFASVDAGHGIDLKTRFGFNLRNWSFRGYAPSTPENSEPTSIDAIYENYSQGTEWTWTNTLNYVRAVNRHNLTILLGHETSKRHTRFEAGSCANLLSGLNPETRYIQDALCDPSTKSVSSTGTRGSLLSFFGKVDDNFADRYYLTLTLRLDRVSRLGHKWGSFPAFGGGWKLSREPNMMLRFGWGITGSQRISDGGIVSQFSGDRGDTFYDIGNSNASVRRGFRVIGIGSPDPEWERTRSANVGIDLEFLDGRGRFSADVYRRKTDRILFDPRGPATAGTPSPPPGFGAMQNNGIDLSIGYRGTIGGNTVWSATLNGGRYKNRILSIDGVGTFFLGPYSLRAQYPVINQIGQPIGAFYGLVADGYYRDSAEAAPFWADGARPGRIRFKDLNNDGAITAADRTVIGSPHPDFTAGLDLSLRRGNWDVSAAFYGSFGNQIFNAQKYWYVFRAFDTNVRKDLLANSAELDGPCAGTTCPGKVKNPNASYPRVDITDFYSRTFSSYWVEDGSYVRLRALQVAYNVPPALVRWIPAARVYVQAENLFTITGYSGIDPALPAWAAVGAGGDIRDQFRGIDGGSYPSSRTITVGISTTF